MTTTRIDATITENDLLKFHLSSIKSDKDYFVKPRSHFVDSEKIFTPIPDQSDTHTFMIFNKKPKVGGSEQRSKNEWIEITTAVVEEKSKEEFCRFNVLMGEILRFELGGHLPKYRMETCANGTYKLLTKKLSNCFGSDFFDYFKARIFITSAKLIQKDGQSIFDIPSYEGNEIFEGMGGAFAIKYLFAENDFHFSNALVTNIDGYILFVPIDNDRNLWPFTHQFLTPKIRESEALDKQKHMTYVSEYKDSIVHLNTKTNLYDWSKSTGVTHGYMGHQHEKDYRRLPLIEYRTPTNWVWMGHLVKPYSKVVSENQMVQNEVSFFQLKATLTPYLKKLIVECQYKKTEFSEYKTALNNRIQQELSDSKEICEKSPVIHEFMETHRIALLQAMIYEVNLAFHDNKHYIPENKYIWDLIWANLSDLITQNFNTLLEAQKLPPLNNSEKEKLKLFSSQCENNLPAVIPDVVKFYETMNRKYAAYAANKRLMPINPQIPEEIKSQSCSMRTT